ncbi:MAG TPA: triple tyrosine motif-containing protein [Chryseolinea sp.]|nr:triple tyrosine motif-containing protein [Chryseolinea sp.]HPH45421.1 triple tyrosine motif-containing protein [Chryseolinea sp.]HPM28756.1 triple tyrosine motif-containing protein [Chryseolinea sp.]
MAQDEQGLMYFATRSGVIEFDGRNWTQITGTGAVYSLQVNKQNKIFWSGVSGYGIIGTNDQGFHELQTTSTNSHDFFQTLIAKEKVFFLSDGRIDINDANQKTESSIIATKETGFFAGMFELFGVVYVNTQDAGIQKIQNNKLVPSTLGFAEEDEVIFSCGLQNYYLIGLANNKVYLCGENLKPREIILEDQVYADASVVVNGTWVNRDLFALGTLRGGVLFIHTASGKTQEIVNYTSGLPDNEVYALMSDKSQSIWAAHEYGFTRVSPFMPFRSFRHYPGIQGNLLCAISYQNDVYAGTSLGLFKLEKEEVYDEIVYYEEVEIKPKQTASTKKSEIVSTPKEEVKPKEPEVESKRKGFLSFLKKNRNKPSEQPLESTPTTVPDQKVSTQKESINPVTKPAYKRIQRTERVLRASNYVFKKVQGIDAKVNQLLEANGELIAVGLGGVFKVDLLTSEPILEAPIRFTYSVNSKKMLLVSTYGDKVLAFENTEQGWQSRELISNSIDDQIHHIFEGNDNELWLCGLDHVYRLNISTSDQSTIETIPFNNPNFDELVGIRWKNEITIANTFGFYRYDRQKKIFNRVDSLAPPNQYFASKENIWYRNAHQWNVIGQEKNQSNLQLLNLFQDLRFITSDKTSDNLWLITGDNELYKFFGEKLTPYESGYPLMLKAIHNGAQKFGNLNQFKIDQLKSAITFEVIQPDYITSQSIEYRYKLKGLAKDWSDWSNANNLVDFPYLPSGDYTLLVEAKDIFGKVLDIDPIGFEVLPPYWKRPWFYALEFVVFAILVLLSLRLSKRYLFISRVLSLLTIIMLIQFIQTVATEVFETRASPVTDFFLQVIVALMILPAEGYIRELMLRAANPEGRIHKFMSRKPKAEADNKNQG